MRSLSSAAILLLIAAAAPAAAQQAMSPHDMNQHGMGQHGMVAMDETSNPADKAFLGAMHDMMVGMHRSMPTGDTDKDFVALMVPHHQSAVDMAKAELQYGRDPELKTLAQAIVDDQQREIALMKAWQDKHPK